MCRRQEWPARSKRRTPVAATAAEHGCPWRCCGCAHCWRAAQAPSPASCFNADCHQLPPLLSRSMQLGCTGRVLPALSAVWGPRRRGPAGCGHRTLPVALSAAEAAAEAAALNAVAAEGPAAGIQCRRAAQAPRPSRPPVPIAAGAGTARKSTMQKPMMPAGSACKLETRLTCRDSHAAFVEPVKE